MYSKIQLLLIFLLQFIKTSTVAHSHMNYDMQNKIDTCLVCYMKVPNDKINNIHYNKIDATQHSELNNTPYNEMNDTPYSEMEIFNALAIEKYINDTDSTKLNSTCNICHNKIIESLQLFFTKNLILAIKDNRNISADNKTINADIEMINNDVTTIVNVFLDNPDASILHKLLIFENLSHNELIYLQNKLQSQNSYGFNIVKDIIKDALEIKSITNLSLYELYMHGINRKGLRNPFYDKFTNKLSTDFINRIGKSGITNMIEQFLKNRDDYICAEAIIKNIFAKINQISNIEFNENDIYKLCDIFISNNSLCGISVLSNTSLVKSSEHRVRLTYKSLKKLIKKAMTIYDSDYPVMYMCEYIIGVKNNIFRVKNNIFKKYNECNEIIDFLKIFTMDKSLISRIFAKKQLTSSITGGLNFIDYKTLDISEILKIIDFLNNCSNDNMNETNVDINIFLIMVDQNKVLPAKECKSIIKKCCDYKNMNMICDFYNSGLGENADIFKLLKLILKTFNQNDCSNLLRILCEKELINHNNIDNYMPLITKYPNILFNILRAFSINNLQKLSNTTKISNLFQIAIKFSDQHSIAIMLPFIGDNKLVEIVNDNTLIYMAIEEYILKIGGWENIEYEINKIIENELFYKNRVKIFEICNNNKAFETILESIIDTDINIDELFEAIKIKANSKYLSKYAFDISKCKIQQNKIKIHMLEKVFDKLYIKSHQSKSMNTDIINADDTSIDNTINLDDTLTCIIECGNPYIIKEILNSEYIDNILCDIDIDKLIEYILE